MAYSLGEVRSFCDSEVFNCLFQIQVAVLTSEKHKVQEQLRTSSEQHQRTMSACQQKIATLQEECRAAQVFQWKKQSYRLKKGKLLALCFLKNILQIFYSFCLSRIANYLCNWVMVQRTSQTVLVDVYHLRWNIWTCTLLFPVGKKLVVVGSQGLFKVISKYTLREENSL